MDPNPMESIIVLIIVTLGILTITILVEELYLAYIIQELEGKLEAIVT